MNTASLILGDVVNLLAGILLEFLATFPLALWVVRVGVATI